MQCLIEGIPSPAAVRARPNGNLIIARYADGVVEEYDIRMRDRHVIANLDPALDSLAVTPDNRVFVSNGMDGSVTEVLSDFKYNPIVPGGLFGPYGLAVQEDGSLWVADGLSLGRLSGSTIARPLTMFSPDGLEPIDIAQIPGHVFVLSWSGDVVCYKDVTKPGLRVKAPRGQYAALFAFDDTHTGIVDRTRNRLLQMDSDGTVVDVMTGLDDPVAAWRDTDGSIYLIQRGGKELMSLSADGASRKSLAKFQRARGVAGDGDWLYVADIGTRQVIAFHRKSCARDVIIDNAPIGPLTNTAESDASDSVFVHNGDLARLCPAPQGGVYAGFNGDGSIRHITRRV
jgi:DNA-binding beta-propeller fold protein YncE